MAVSKKKPTKPKVQKPTSQEQQIWADLQDVACPVILVPFRNLTAKAIKNLPDVLGVREVELQDTDESAFAIPIYYMNDERILLLRAGKKIPY